MAGTVAGATRDDLPGPPDRRESWRRAFVHLRLPFSLVLTPLYLWGVYLALSELRHGLSDGGHVALAGSDGVSARFWLRILLGYLIVHGPLYGGMNAFNSYYDRDEGPIGALAEPPPVDRTVWIVAVVAKGLALAASLALGLPFALLTLGAVVFSALYSHPRWRWKERPVWAALTVFCGQGGVGVMWGWLAAGGGRHGPPDWTFWIGLLGAALWTLGCYPLTGSYQVASDGARGMRTLAVALGVDGCFRFAAWVAVPGGLLLGLVLVDRGALLAALAAGIYLALAGLRTWRWRRAFAGQTPKENQRNLMHLVLANGAFFSLIFGLLIARLSLL